MDAIIEQLLKGLFRLFAAALEVPIEQWNAFNWGVVAGVAALGAFLLWAAIFGRRRSKAAHLPDEARPPEPARRSDFHGERAGMFFRIGYLLAILVPLPMETEAGILMLMTVCATWLIVPIGLAKTGIVGEMMGIVFIVFAWVGRFAGPPVVSWLFPEASADDLWRVLGASIPPVVCAIALTVLKAIEGIDRATF